MCTRQNHKIIDPNIFQHLSKDAMLIPNTYLTYKAENTCANMNAPYF